MSISEICIVLSGLIICATAWGNVCVSKTMLDRITVLSSIKGRPLSGPPVMIALEAVSFNRHLLARIFLRDQWKLFDPIVLDAVKNPRSDILEMTAIEVVKQAEASEPQQSVH